MTDQPELSPEAVEREARRIGMDTITEHRGLYTITRPNPDALKAATMLRALRTALTEAEEAMTTAYMVGESRAEERFRERLTASQARAERAEAAAAQAREEALRGIAPSLHRIIEITDKIAEAPASAERWADRIEEVAREILALLNSEEEGQA